MRAGSAAAVALLVVVVGGTAPATAAGATRPAAADGPCPGPPGVTVVVDPGPLGGVVEAVCVADGADRPASEVVEQAGFPLTYVGGQPFVCRVDGRPDAAREPCGRIPPGDAYWGLFWSDGTSAAWTYSSTAVTGLRVPAGGWIGWRFEDGGEREDPGRTPATAAAGPAPAPDDSEPAPDQTAGRDAGDGDGPVFALAAVAAAGLALAALRTGRRRRG